MTLQNIYHWHWDGVEEEKDNLKYFHIIEVQKGIQRSANTFTVSSIKILIAFNWPFFIQSNLDEINWRPAIIKIIQALWNRR